MTPRAVRDMLVFGRTWTNDPKVLAWEAFVRERCAALKLSFAEYHRYRAELRDAYAAIGAES